MGYRDFKISDTVTSMLSSKSSATARRHISFSSTWSCLYMKSLLSVSIRMN
jgi:hypothetical protein